MLGIRVLDELGKCFQSNGVVEAYAVKDWELESKPVIYILTTRPDKITDVFYYVVSLNKDIQLRVAKSAESPILQDKRLIWYEGDWRDFA